jgi:hypothetical protein
MMVLSFDPGRATGWAAAKDAADGKPLVIDSGELGRKGKELNYPEYANVIESLISVFHPDVVTAEDWIHIPRIGVKSQGRIRGIIEGLAYAHYCEFQLIRVSDWRTWYSMPKKRAKGLSVTYARHFTGRDILFDDEAEAVLMAIYWLSVRAGVDSLLLSGAMTRRTG